MSTTERVQAKVKRLPKGEPLAFDLFKNCGSPAGVRKAVSRMAESGELVRLAKGVYARPKPMRYLKNGALPAPERVAKVIAKQNSEVLAPHGANLARRFGLSTQVPMQTAFFTTGRTRKVSVGKTAVAFEHAPEYLIKMQDSAAGKALLALYHLGPRAATPETLEKLCKWVPREEFRQVKKERLAPWMREALRTLEAGERVR